MRHIEEKLLPHPLPPLLYSPGMVGGTEAAGTVRCTVTAENHHPRQDGERASALEDRRALLLELRLVVKGGGQAELVYDSLKGGSKTKVLVLQ